MSEATVEVKYRPPAGRLTQVPEELVEHFHAKGYRVHLESADTRIVAMVSTMDRHPVLADELPEELLRTLTTMRGYRITVEGTLQFGDCIVYCQSDQAREYFRDQARLAWAQQSSPDAVRSDMEAWNRAAPSGAPRFETDRAEIPKVEDFVHHGPGFARAMAAMEAAKKEASGG